ncbi:hypothetical protein SAQ01S_34950 [Sphingomonas aquatilis NBRC 16722]|jgi:hypothetical protein|uniref:Lipoprotein n=1 Tax=Sphingomonas aquatilis TaxID=93063 RepID=A0AAW3TXF2_9SPHN|nr:hypothetical protein [Sphingomonas aquatilis]MBB3877476.1 hypothetical protein [Sphingomonas aquatilis]GEM73729.1 hypothetical protein SAQ01S_34950 [Sphingomonas aquatilis NBRC 16722]HEX2017990.1 hypothetical protein [Aurantimonas sp.]
MQRASCGSISIGLLSLSPIVLGLAGCIDPSQRIATSLIRYGLDEKQAQCVGDRLEARLSTGQLRQLGRAARGFHDGDPSPGRLTIGDLVRVSSRIEDVRVPLEVARAAAGCNVLADGAARL